MRPLDLLGLAAMLAAAALVATRKPRITVVVMQQRLWAPGAAPPPAALPPPMGPMPPPGSNPRDCPVCGWSPCLDDCPIGFTKWDLERHDAEEDFRRECDIPDDEEE